MASSVPPLAKSSNAFSVTRMMLDAMNSAPSRAPVDYIVAGESGQALAASVRESDPVTLHVYGLDDGQQLAPLPERRQLWAGRLPATQDYVVSVVPADEGARYELTVTLR